MIVTQCDIVAGEYTVFHVAERIPPNTFYVVLDGKKYELFPVYDADTMTFAIKGEHDMIGKDVSFAENSEVRR